MVEIYELPGILRVDWIPEVRAVLDTWDSYLIAGEQFAEVIARAIAFARENGARAWIVDSSVATHCLPAEVQGLSSSVFQRFHEIGITDFVSIPPETTLARMSFDKITTNAGPFGIRLHDVADVDDAIALLRREQGHAA